MSLVLSACGQSASPSAPIERAEPVFDPLAVARASIGRTANREATVPPQCYTKTGPVSNPCWTCHTEAQLPDIARDFDLQAEYAFSEPAMTNHWTNLFVDRRAVVAATEPDEILAWVRQDNYRALGDALSSRSDYPGWVPDLDLERGFDAAGFARDGSDWRAFRYQPFPGTFWQTNGSADDVFVRLPVPFRQLDGTGDRPTYERNLALLDRAFATTDGELPASYAGDARLIALERGRFPRGTEFLHTVRYLDPDAPSFLARRMKEVRYARKVELLDTWATQRAYESEIDEKEEGVLPRFAGAPEVGYRNGYGWQLQGFIEDQAGRLRLQTEEEHLFCMGCHGTLGVTADHTFSWARKLPGRDGWGHQRIEGLVDVPQDGHNAPEILTYFRRVQGADELRANAEMLSRFFPGGVLDEAEVLRAAPGGDRDLAWLLLPSRQRALDLDAAYREVVREQSFTRGRDAVLAPATNVHETIGNGPTELGAAGTVFHDGRLRLSRQPR